MTLLQAQKRLAEVIAENIRCGRAERNEMELGVEIGQYGPLRQNGRRSYTHEYRKVEGFSSTMVTAERGTYGATAKAESVFSPAAKKAQKITARVA